MAPVSFRYLSQLKCPAEQGEFKRRNTWGFGSNGDVSMKINTCSKLIYFQWIKKMSTYRSLFTLVLRWHPRGPSTSGMFDPSGIFPLYSWRRQQKQNKLSTALASLSVTNLQPLPISASTCHEHVAVKDICGITIWWYNLFLPFCGTGFLMLQQYWPSLGCNSGLCSKHKQTTERKFSV